MMAPAIPRRSAILPRRQTAWLAFLPGLLLLTLPPYSHATECQLSDQHEGLSFPVHQIEPAWRCHLQPIITDYTTVGTTGPVQTPLSAALYSYFLDRPVVTAALAQRLGIGPFQASVRGPNQFWVNDGDGTQGLLTLLHQDGAIRIYHVDGFHEGRIFPMVKAQAVVFMTMRPAQDRTGHDSVETTLVSYVKLESRMWSALVALLRPLVGDAITRKLARGFDATNQLSQLIAQDRSRILRDAEAPPLLSPDELESLKLALQGAPRASGPSQP